MTRRLIYASALAVFLSACAMTIASIAVPRWISWDVTSNAGTRIHYTYGLHSRCSSLTDACEYFPRQRDCESGDRYFCSMWRSVGFLMSFAVVMEGVTGIALVAALAGGREKRVHGWKLVAGLLVVCAAVQAAAMGIVSYLFEHDSRFFPGWNLDASFILCTVSWCVTFLAGFGLVGSAFLLEPEGGYELLSER